jgi:hypothetical protein
MRNITVYANSACVQRNATFNAMDRGGIMKAATTSPSILCVMRHTDSGELQQAPVVVTPAGQWSGFRPDQIKAEQARLTTSAAPVGAVS